MDGTTADPQLLLPPSQWIYIRAKGKNGYSGYKAQSTFSPYKALAGKHKGRDVTPAQRIPYPERPNDTTHITFRHGTFVS